MSSGANVAFVVGNDAYPGEDALSCCVADATAMECVLVERGFDVRWSQVVWEVLSGPHPGCLGVAVPLPLR